MKKPTLRGPILLICCGLLVIGTACVNRSVHLPRLRGPGSAEFQRAIAVRYDPYPDQDAGPEIVGGRPQDFSRQVPEPTRVQQNRSPWAARIR